MKLPPRAPVPSNRRRVADALADRLASPLLLLVTFVVAIAPLVGGCSDRNTAVADMREVRLTADAGWCIRPVYSPDGRLLAFSSIGDEDRYHICTIPSGGGDVRTVTPDSLSLLVFGWTPAGDGFYAMGLPDERTRIVGLNGEVRKTWRELGLTGIVSVADDGPRFLVIRFRGDNFDLGIFDADRDTLTYETESEGWEVDGCLGPEPGDVTAVLRDAPGSSKSTVVVHHGHSGTSETLDIEPARIYTPRWSPDRRFLAYATDLTGDRDLWVYDRSSARALQLTAGAEDDVFPAWSPDGRDIVFARRTSTMNVFVIDTATLEPRQLTEGEQRNRVPKLSPDGTLVAFIHMLSPSESGGRGGFDLSVVPAAGGEVRRLGIEGLSVVGDDASFAWSPDGREIACAADDGSGETDIYRVPLADGVPVRVTVTAGSELGPVWSPDGTRISYTRTAGGETQVWIIPATGGVAKQVSFQKALNQYGLWSEDSRRLCYMSSQESGVNELRVVDAADPGDDRVIYSSADPASPIAWTKDGTGVLAWKRGEERYTVWYIPVDHGEATEIARPMGTSGPTKHVLKFTEAGERYRDRIYPNGLDAYADGEHVSDVYVMRVADLLKSEFGKPARKEPS